MQALGETPFAHGLALAWADDRFTKTEFKQLDALQEALNIPDNERAEIEELYEEKLTEGVALRGESSASLVEWIDSVRALSSADAGVSAELARKLGATALRAGITREGWKNASLWMKQLGLGASFAEGCWMEGGVVPPLQAVPLALAPAAKFLSLLE